MRLQNKIAIITGGGTGIGKGIAMMFASQGAQVIICGRRKEPLDETVELIKKSLGNAIAMQVDISKKEEVDALIQTTKKQFGRVDILVNNAGIFKGGTIDSVSDNDWDSVISIDLKGVVNCSRAAIAVMMEQQYGKIINIASIAGIVGFAGSAAYCASKAAVINLTREMALDYASKNIYVNAIAPGVIVSEMTESFLNDPAAKKNFLDKTPLGKIGNPEDIAYGAVYLASDESNFVTGQTVIIDGGWTIQ